MKTVTCKHNVTFASLPFNKINHRHFCNQQGVCTTFTLSAWSNKLLGWKELTWNVPSATCKFTTTRLEQSWARNRLSSLIKFRLISWSSLTPKCDSAHVGRLWKSKRAMSITTRRTKLEKCWADKQLSTCRSTESGVLRVKITFVLSATRSRIILVSRARNLRSTKQPKNAGFVNQNSRGKEGLGCWPTCAKRRIVWNWRDSVALRGSPVATPAKGSQTSLTAYPVLPQSANK
jgi:hypothetical protein